MSEEQWTFREAAKVFDTHYKVISGLVAALQIETAPVPRNGKARGLDVKAMKRLAKSLDTKFPPKAS